MELWGVGASECGNLSMSILKKGWISDNFERTSHCDPPKAEKQSQLAEGIVL